MERADDVAVIVLERLWPSGHGEIDTEVTETIAAADRAGAMLIGRWLTGGEPLREDERRQLAALGEMIDRVALADLVKAYLAWRDAIFTILDEEALRLGSPAELVDEVRTVVSRNNEGSIVRMARGYEEQRQALRAQLDSERAKLARLALHDVLTGLPNRALLFDRIEHALCAASRYERTLALLFIDLDGFKSINDRLGHEAGDQLLVAVAGRVSSVVRKADTVARLGGDEFVVLCERTAGAGWSASAAERITGAFSRPFPLRGERLRLTASVGVADARPGDTARDLLRRADLAMYAAKQMGPGRHDLGMVRLGSR